MSPTACPRPGPATHGFDPGSHGLPPELLADPRLGPTAKLIAAAIVTHWARIKHHCWPADATIAAAIGRSPGHVQRGLRQLEQAGWIKREHTATVPGGRRIWLCWRQTDLSAGADRPRAPAPGSRLAPARDKPVVIVNQGKEPEEDRPGSQRSRSGPASSALSGPLSSALAQVMPPAARPGLPEPCRETPDHHPTPSPVHPVPTSPSASQPPPCPTPSGPTTVAAGPVSPALSPAPRPAPPGALNPPVAAGLTPAEQARLGRVPEATRQKVLMYLALNDPVLLGEARRWLAQPPPAEPAPQSLGTAELLSGLPGRPDRVAHAAGRLSQELGDESSYRYYLKVAEAVCRRERPAEALLAAWRQGRDPRSARPGAVFATAWKRGTGG